MCNLKRANALPLPQKKPHEHHQKPRNASASYLSDSCWNHGSRSCRHPCDRNWNPGPGSGHFDSHWQIVTLLLVLIFTATLQEGRIVSPNFSGWILADVIVKRESVCAVGTTPRVREKPLHLPTRSLSQPTLALHSEQPNQNHRSRQKLPRAYRSCPRPSTP